MESCVRQWWETIYDQKNGLKCFLGKRAMVQLLNGCNKIDSDSDLRPIWTKAQNLNLAKVQLLLSYLNLRLKHAFSHIMLYLKHACNHVILIVNMHLIVK